MKLEITFRYLVVELLKDWVNFCICSTLFIQTHLGFSWFCAHHSTRVALFGNFEERLEIF